MQKLLLLCCILLVSQIALTQTNNKKEVEIIKSLRAASNEAIAKHDLDGLSKHWLDESVIITGNSAQLIGKDTIVATWKKLFQSNPKVVYVRTPTEITISNNDSLAWETGTWKAFNSYSNGGSYSSMWKKSKGSWNILVELFVSLF